MENPRDPTERVVNALDLIALELESLRLLKEYELGMRVVHNADPNLVKTERKK